MSETRWVQDGLDGHGHPRYVKAPTELLPDPRDGSEGPEDVHREALQFHRAAEEEAKRFVEAHLANQKAKVAG